MALTAKANDQNLNLREVTTRSGVEEGKATEWLKGSSEPTKEEVEAICKYLGCSVDDINKMINTNKAKSKALKEAEGAKKEAPAKTKNLSKKQSKAKESTSKTTKPAKDTSTKKRPAVQQKEDKPKGIESNTKKKTENTEPNKANSNTSKRGEVEMENKAEDSKPKETTIKADTNQPAEKQSKSKPSASKKTSKSSGSSSKKASNNKKILSEESEAYIRKIAGLKKSEPVDDTTIATAINLTAESIKQKLDALVNLEKDITETLYKNLEANTMDPKLKKLMDLANNSSDEGIELAITILKKWKK